MTESEKLGYYYKQLQVIEDVLIQSKSVGDMGRIFQMEAEKEKVWFAVKWLESQGVQPLV